MHEEKQLYRIEVRWSENYPSYGFVEGFYVACSNIDEAFKIGKDVLKKRNEEEKTKENPREGELKISGVTVSGLVYIKAKITKNKKEILTI